MQKKLTILFAFAIFVLVLGWAITPVQADPPRPTHNHGGGDPEPPTVATVDLAGGMLTMNFPVSVIQDNSKKIHFENQNFDFKLEGPVIEMVSLVPSPPLFPPPRHRLLCVSWRRHRKRAD